jgi:hypothetical protein
MVNTLNRVHLPDILCILEQDVNYHLSICMYMVLTICSQYNEVS